MPVSGGRIVFVHIGGSIAPDHRASWAAYWERQALSVGLERMEGESVAALHERIVEHVYGPVSSPEPRTPEHMAHLAASCTDEVFRRWLEIWSMPPGTTRDQMCSRVLEYGPGEVTGPEDASELARLLQPAPEALPEGDEPLEDLEWLKGLGEG